MSSPVASNPDRIGRTLARSGITATVPCAKARRKRIVEIAVATSVLLLMMLGGMALRALLSVVQGID